MSEDDGQREVRRSEFRLAVTEEWELEVVAKMQANRMAIRSRGSSKARKDQRRSDILFLLQNVAPQTTREVADGLGDLASGWPEDHLYVGWDAGSVHSALVQMRAEGLVESDGGKPMRWSITPTGERWCGRSRDP